MYQTPSHHFNSIGNEFDHIGLTTIASNFTGIQYMNGDVTKLQVSTRYTRNYTPTQ